VWVTSAIQTIIENNWRESMPLSSLRENDELDHDAGGHEEGRSQASLRAGPGTRPKHGAAPILTKAIVR